MFSDLIGDLFLASSTRGRDASGLCISDTEKISLYKNSEPAMQFIEDQNYKKLLDTIKSDDLPRIVIGHTRAETKGDHRYNINNHPIKAGSVIGVHNGIISNDDKLFENYHERFDRSGKVDSEIIFRLIDYKLQEGCSIVEAVKETSGIISGTFACAFVTSLAPRYLTIFSNQQYSAVELYNFKDAKWLMFASTEAILDSALKNKSWAGNLARCDKFSLKEEGLRIDSKTGKMYLFPIK